MRFACLGDFTQDRLCLAFSEQFQNIDYARVEIESLPI